MLFNEKLIQSNFLLWQGRNMAHLTILDRTLAQSNVFSAVFSS
ncbi:hypothetical protein THOG05_330015 [Vibrio rotiferianus]|nr:hypothetical protein THOG05_330015 [Vibrio rotiferianus]